MHEHSFEYVLMPTHMHTAEPTSFIEVGAWSFEQFPAFPEESLPAVAPDPTSIRVDRVPFGFLVGPRLWSAIGFADVGANRQRLEVTDHRATVVALVGDDLLDHSHRNGDSRHGFELLGGLGKRLLNCGRVARVCVLHRDANDRASVEIDSVLGLRPSFIFVILASGSCGCVQS
jgi:hypothetical protein